MDPRRIADLRAKERHNSSPSDPGLGSAKGTSAQLRAASTTMPPTKASAKYSKKDGSLVVFDDKKYVFWTPSDPPGATPTITIPVADITNLQQTPATSKAIALKVFVNADSYVFSFTHKENARKEQENVTEILRNTIAANKASTAAALVPSAATTPKPAAGGGENGGAQSAAMAIAKAVSSKAADEGWYDDSKLMADANLQRSLLESNKALKERFNQALKDKPESVSISQFNGQFWKARLHLLRAHAIENAQKKGEYNVLPEIKFIHKPAEKEGEPDTKQLQITKEQIKLIFKQYPVVSEAYNENSPPLSPAQFWTKFFQSRLLKKLKGEKISDQDPRDSILDKYLDRRQGEGPAYVAHVPHFLDLEGNEQNHSQRKGNRPDQDMRPSQNDKVPILRVLNNLSEKMMSHVAPEDGEAHAPIGMDEETFDQLRLRDLAVDDVDNRVVLNVKEQQRYVGGDKDSLSAEAKLYAQQDPEQVLSTLRTVLEPSQLGSDAQGTLRLDRVIGYSAESDSESDDESATTPKKKRNPRIGSHTAMSTANSTILSSIHRRHAHAASSPTEFHGLSQSTFDALTTTHNTTTEFLHYFWVLFLSGDASRTKELEQLVSTLDRSLDRINAVADTAEKEREKKVEGIKRQLKEYYDKTGKRRKVDMEALAPGGKKVVERMVRPTVVALGKATGAYRKALEEQMKENGVAGVS
jgi:transcription initiation factor TFIIH subunit 1